MRKPLQALEDIPNGKNHEDWGVFDMGSLEAQCQNNPQHYSLRAERLDYSVDDIHKALDKLDALEKEQKK